jgi:DNA-binding NtrC family response regulator
MKNILIADDNLMILHSLSSFLRLTFKDYNVLMAEDGEKAIELLATNPVDLILTDLEMPKVDGYKVIEYAKKNYPSTPLIIMTGSWSLDLEQLIKKTGVMRCIEKPFRLENIADLTMEALRENANAPLLISPAEPADKTC